MRLQLREKEKEREERRETHRNYQRERIIFLMLHVFLMAEQGPIYESCYTKHIVFLQFRDGLCFAMKFINNDQEFNFSTNLDKFVEGIRIFYK